MKKWIALILVLVMVLGMLGCGNINAKAKLVDGAWIKHTEGNVTTPNGTKLFRDVVIVYDFNKSDSITKTEIWYEELFGVNTLYKVEYFGSYKISNGEISIHYSSDEYYRVNNGDVSVEKETIDENESFSYYISDYNHEIVFDTDSAGNSSWGHIEKDDYKNVWDGFLKNYGEYIGIPQSIANELKIYKELLDSGKITQGEYEVIKKQLLGQ